MSKKTVWVTWAESESGDYYGPFVFSKEPTDEQFQAFWECEAPGEFEPEEPGPGDWDSWLYTNLEEVEVQDPPKRK